MARRRSLWFIGAGLLAIAVIHIALAVGISRLVVDRYLKREAVLSQEFLMGILATEEHPEDLFAQPAPSPTLIRFASHVRQMPGVVRANVYSPDGFIRHSTDANLVGVQFKDNRDLAKSFRDRFVINLLDSVQAGKNEHFALNAVDGDRLIEAYIPIPDKNKNVLAVVEFYRKEGTLREVAGELKWLMALAGVVDGLLLLAMAMLLLRLRRD